MSFTKNISLELYSAEKIMQAIHDFSEVAEINLYDAQIVIKHESKEEAQTIFHEFINYVLAL